MLKSTTRILIFFGLYAALFFAALWYGATIADQTSLVALMVAGVTAGPAALFWAIETKR